MLWESIISTCSLLFYRQKWILHCLMKVSPQRLAVDRMYLWLTWAMLGRIVTWLQCVAVLLRLSCRWGSSPSHQAERGVPPFHQKVARIQVLVSPVNFSCLWASYPLFQPCWPSSPWAPLMDICHHIVVLTGVVSLCRHSATKGIVIAMVCTFFEVFNVPVFWPILVMYFIMLFCITMKRQIKVNAHKNQLAALPSRKIRSPEAFFN